MDKQTVFLSEEEQLWRNDVISQLAKEARIPIQRAMMATWAQFDGNTFRTTTGREVQMSNLLTSAIRRLPCSGRYVFTMSPFPPTIPDKLLEPARKRFKHRKLVLAMRSL